MSKGTLEQYSDDARQAAAWSYGLWQPVNRAICEVLDDAVCNRHSRKRVCERLLQIAGPERRGEPVSVGSFRSAAKQIEKNADRLTLL